MCIRDRSGLKHNGEKIENSIQKIDTELMNVFSERKIELLKLLKSILEEEEYFFMEGIVLYGTRNFYNVWEVVCQYHLFKRR